MSQIRTPDGPSRTGTASTEHADMVDADAEDLDVDGARAERAVVTRPGNPQLTATARRVAVVVLAIAVAQAVLALLFAWPAGRATPHGVPIAVAGPALMAEAGARSLEKSPPGGFTVTRLPDLTAARAAVMQRRVYGAVVIEDQGLRLLVASGASPAIAQQLVQALDAVQARAQGASLQVEDLAPTPGRDPRGLVPGTALLALLITSIGGGYLIFSRFPRPAERVAGLIGLAVAAGAAGELVLHGVLGALDGPVLAEAAVVGLVVLGAAAATTAFGVIADTAGIALAAVLVVAVGYPISGAISAPELVPQPWGAVGRILPAGAGSSALRSVAFFDGAGATGPMIVLCGWSALALLVIAAPALLDAAVRRRIGAGTP
jgi:hypothetical protein